MAVPADADAHVDAVFCVVEKIKEESFDGRAFACDFLFRPGFSGLESQSLIQVIVKGTNNSTTHSEGPLTQVLPERLDGFDAARPREGDRHSRQAAVRVVGAVCPPRTKAVPFGYHGRNTLGPSVLVQGIGGGQPTPKAGAGPGLVQKQRQALVAFQVAAHPHQASPHPIRGCRPDAGPEGRKCRIRVFLD
jgi:hypothetical protein